MTEQWQWFRRYWCWFEG